MLYDYDDYRSLYTREEELVKERERLGIKEKKVSNEWMKENLYSNEK